MSSRFGNELEAIIWLAIIGLLSIFGGIIYGIYRLIVYLISVI